MTKNKISPLVSPGHRTKIPTQFCESKKKKKENPKKEKTFNISFPILPKNPPLFYYHNLI